MEGAARVEAQALFDYDRQHFDELSFNTGDIIKVLKEIEGGWWHGELNDTQGWFPSNYVRKLLPSSRTADTSHLLSFQQEIVQHILEGESKQIADLNLLLRLLQPHIEVLSKFAFFSKLPVFLEKVTLLIRLHESIAKVLEKMKPLSQPKFVGKLFLDVAKNLDQLSGEYTRSCAYIEFGLQSNSTSIPIAIGASGQDLYSAKTKSLFASVYDRLSRYPTLLRETERYYEDPHPDRVAICKAVQVYSEVLDRCNLLRSLREVDIEILSSEIRGLPDQSRAQIGDLTLTLKANICTTDADGHLKIDSTKPQAVLLLFPTFILLLSSVSPRIYQFRMHIPLLNISVTASQENENLISVKVLGGGSPLEEHHLHLWCTGVCTRDLFYSTIVEYIRDSKWELEEVEFRHTLPRCASSQAAPSTTDGAVLRHRSASRSTKTDTSGLQRRRSAGGGSEDTEAASFATGAAAAASHLFALRPSHSGPLCGPSAEDDVDVLGSPPSPSSTSAPSPPPPRTNTVAVTDLTNLPGCRFLPHEVCSRPHVKWPEDILTIAKRQETTDLNAFNNRQRNQQSQQDDLLTHLRLDCTPSQCPCSLISGGDMPPRSGARAPVPGGHGSRGSRPNSPGRSGASGEARGGGTASAGKSVRRKRTDRQKSAINADDILRSAGHFHEITQRNERDAKILQIIELYCGSGLPKGALKPLDLTQLRLSGTEMRMKESSIPPTSQTVSVTPSAASRVYENIEPPPSMVPLRPPPVILPTSSSARKV